mmetsp:Transcript_5758/g.13555  ORF Transcript_5758/g.13555 Transcript_5758/m.13555 type:complete len:92 (+) Transcript_5758:1927-2202(+)
MSYETVTQRITWIGFEQKYCKVVASSNKIVRLHGDSKLASFCRLYFELFTNCSLTVWNPVQVPPNNDQTMTVKKWHVPPECEWPVGETNRV